MVLGLHKFSLFVEKHATSGAGWVDWHRERLWYLAIPFGSLSMMAMLHARCPEAVPKPGNSKWRWSPWRPSEFIPIRSRTFSCRSELFKQCTGPSSPLPAQSASSQSLRSCALCRQWRWRTSATSRTGRLHARQLPANVFCCPKRLHALRCGPFRRTQKLRRLAPWPCPLIRHTSTVDGSPVCCAGEKFFAWHLLRSAQQCAPQEAVEQTSFILTQAEALKYT